MPRKRDPKMIEYHRIAMAEYREAKKRRENGKMSEATFKKNFRGAVALSSGQAYANIKKTYHAWLKKHGHPIPVSKPRRVKKKRTKKKSAKNTKRSRST